MKLLHSISPLQLLMIMATFVLVGCEPEFKLEAQTTQPSYSQGEFIEIELKLRNTGSVTGLVSDVIPGTLQLTSIKKDGIALSGRDGIVTFGDDLGAWLNSSLQAVAPSNSLDFIWRSERDVLAPGLSDPNLAGQAFKVVSFDNSSDYHPSKIYSVHEPGSYEFELVYKYPITVSNQTNLFTNKTDATTVQFQVTP